MALIKPQAHLYNKGEKTKVKVFKTYRELKKKLKEYLEENDEVSVYRSKRSEWGEWFENWGLNAQRKPYIKNSGWS